VLLGAAGTAALISIPGRPAVAADPYTGYLMAHFTGESATGAQIYFATSTDALHWTDLNGSQPVLTSTVGERGVRDPALVRSPAATYAMPILCCGSTRSPP
jgi:hypothetical protein